MKKMFKNTMNTFLLSSVVLMSVITSVSCTEDIDTGSRYTFTGNTIGSFLEENEDIYSDFVYILKRANRMNLMKAYGDYTCFAPTNEAVQAYLVEQDSLWRTTQDPTLHIRSPYKEDLSDSMCIVIAQTHLLNKTYLTTDMEGDVIPDMNLNDRFLSVKYDKDENNHPIIKVNGDSRIISKDEEVENGVVHTVDRVVALSSNTVPMQLKEYPYFSIFSRALRETHIDKVMEKYNDPTYLDGKKKFRHYHQGQTDVPYPKNRRYGYTLFAETDSVFSAAGINTYEDLVRKCNEWYPTYDASAEPSDPSSPVYQFVAYHILDRQLTYQKLTYYKIKTNECDSEKVTKKDADRVEHYETLNHRLMKLTTPRSNKALQNSTIVNYVKDYSGAKAEHINATVIPSGEFAVEGTVYEGFIPSALNGMIHPVNKILLYDEDLFAGYVLNDIMRFDFASLLPEFTTNAIRWEGYKSINNSGYYVPHDYSSEHLQFNNPETMLWYLLPYGGWSNFQGDEMMAKGPFDLQYKLPPLPEGTYEIRMGYSVTWGRGTVQFYLDNEITGIPIDLNIYADNPRVGWIKDSETPDNGVTNDKEMKNRGYLKGPTTQRSYSSMDSRDDKNTIRVVVARKHLVPSDDGHWLRMKNVRENATGEEDLQHDYLEIVPVSVLANEDLSLSEKRK